MKRHKRLSPSERSTCTANATNLRIGSRTSVGRLPRVDRASLTYKRADDNFQSRFPPTYPRGGIEFRQQEENVLVSWLQRFVLTHAMAVVAPHCEAGGQLSEAGCDVGLPLVKLVQLPAGPPLQGHVPQQLIDVEKGYRFTLNPPFFCFFFPKSYLY